MPEAYNSQGQIQVLFFPTVGAIADPAAPTDAELATGIVLGDGALAYTAPGTKPATIDATPITAKASRTLPALATISNASLTMARGDKSDADSYALFNTMKTHEGKTGWLVDAPRGSTDGFAAGGIVDVYPATLILVAAGAKAPGKPSEWMLEFSHNGEFHENRLIVAD